MRGEATRRTTTTEVVTGVGAYKEHTTVDMALTSLTTLLLFSGGCTHMYDASVHK